MTTRAQRRLPALQQLGWSLAVGALLGCLPIRAWSDALPTYRPKGAAVRHVALLSACEAGDLEAVRNLLKRGADPAWVAPDGYDFRPAGPAVLLAAFRGQAAIVELFLEQRPELLKTHGCTLLDSALEGLAAAADRTTRARHLQIIKLLIDRKVDVSRPDLGGYTPLMAAARTGQLEAVRMLLDAGASAQAKSNNGETALALARASAPSPERSAIVSLLMQVMRVP